MRDIIKALKCTYFAAWSAFWLGWDVGRSENLGGACSNWSAKMLCWVLFLVHSISNEPKKDLNNVLSLVFWFIRYQNRLQLRVQALS